MLRLWRAGREFLGYVDTSRPISRIGDGRAHSDWLLGGSRPVEAEGTFDHPAYKAAIEILMYRHVCRLQTWPEPLRRSLAGFNDLPYKAIQGPNEFCFTGSIKSWDRIADLPRLSQPALVMCRLHDELTPACTMRVHHALPNSRVKGFQNSSHTAFFEEPDEYLAILTEFLEANRAITRPTR
jgi:proline iminopeptidase